MLEGILRHRLATGDTIVPADVHDRVRFIAVSDMAAYAAGSDAKKMWSIRIPAMSGQKLTGIFEGLDRAALHNLLNGADPSRDLDIDLEIMSRADLLAEAKKLRAGIRTHRDSSGHNLCWFHPELWGLLPDRVNPKPEVPSHAEFLHRCVLYRDSLGKEPKHELTEEEKRAIGRQVHEDFLAVMEEVHRIGAEMDEESRRRAREAVLKSF